MPRRCGLRKLRLLKRVFIAGLVLAATAAYAQTAQIVKQVTVRGNKAINSTFITDNLRRIKVGKVFLRTDAEQDEVALLNTGFFQAVNIQVRELNLAEVEVIVDVNENPVVREIRILGNTVLSSEEITALVVENQQIGQIWVNRRALPIREAIQNAYQLEGYFVQLAALEPDSQVPGALKIEIIEPRVRNITITGASRTRRSTIDKLMKTKPGQVLSFDQWRRDLEEMLATQWFERIDPTQPTPTENVGEFDLNVDVAEARTAQLTAGVALDPQSRLVGTISFNDANWRGKGQTLGVQLSQATIGNGLSAEVAYSDRFFDANGTRFRASVFSRVVYFFTGNGLNPLDVDNDDARFDQRRTGFTFGITREHNDDFVTTIGVIAQNVKTLNETTIDKDRFVRQDGDVAVLELSGAYDTRHPTVEPYTGRIAKLTLEPGYAEITAIGGAVEDDTHVLGKNTFLRSSVEYRQYWSMTTPDPDAEFDEQTRHVLAVRGKYGRVDGTSPFFEQIFLGGSGSLRGYDNQRFWGKESILTTVEYRMPLQKSFSIIGFLDYGGAWGGYGSLKNFEQSDEFKMHMGYGIGLAFRTPIGPIRIDFALNEEGSTRTHFTFGTSF